MISVQAFEGKHGHYFPSEASDGPDSDLQLLLDLKLVVRLDASGSLKMVSVAKLPNLVWLNSPWGKGTSIPYQFLNMYLTLHLQQPR